MKKKQTKDPLGMSTFMISMIIDEINEQFTSITNQSFRLGFVPDILKKIHISPIPKPGKTNKFQEMLGP